MNSLAIIERRGQRVLTTQQLAESYGVEDKRIRDNYTNNKERYIENKHFIKIEGEELKAFKNDPETLGVVGERASSVYLWTERGALLHAKSLNTDMAWRIYDMLVETYYSIKIQKPSCIEDVLIIQLQEMKNLKKELQETKNQTATVKEQTLILQHRLNNLDTTNIEGTPRQRLNVLIRKYAYQESIPHNRAWQEFRHDFNTAFGMNIEQRRNNYLVKQGIKDLSYPEFLERTGLIEDALRVADKMLNKSA